MLKIISNFVVGDPANLRALKCATPYVNGVADFSLRKNEVILYYPLIIDVHELLENISYKAIDVN